MTENQLAPLVSLKQLDAFQCIGSSCEDTCCAGWNVQIDAATIAKWSSSETTSHYKKHLRILETSTDPNEAAEIVLEKNGNCPFLDAEKLCKIQKENGHDYLSHVCKSFPRSKNSFFGVREENMSLACPAAARLILNAVEPIEIGFKEEIAQHPDVITMHLPSRDLFGEIDLTSAWEFRSLIMKIIQNRSISLENRLILIGIISKNLDDELNKSGVNKSNVFIAVYNKFKELLDSNQEVSSLIPVLPDSPKTKLIFLKTLINVVAPYSRSHPRYSQFFKNLVTGLKLDTNSTEQELINNYVSLRAQYLKNNNISLILENYVFHLFFKELFPFQGVSVQFASTDNAPCLKQFLNLALRIFLIKEHLIALSNGKEIVSSEAVSLIQSFTRVYEHRESFQEELKALTNSNNFNSLPHLCILLQS